jgi:long-chain acyl-CoA synthetase
MNLTELLDNTAGRWPHKAAVIEDDTTVSYEELSNQTREYAAQLEALNLQAGQRVGLRLPNSIQYVAWTFAIWRRKGVVVPIPMEFKEEEAATIAAALQLAAVISRQPGEGRAPVLGGCFLAWSGGPVRARHNELNIAFIRFTSGTTNARKGVVLSHETIRDRVWAANKTPGVSHEDIVMWNLPMSHHFLVTIVLYLSTGATIVLARHVLAGPFLEAIHRWGGTMLYAAPFHYGLLARDSSGRRLDSVRLAVSTTGPLPREVAAAFHARYGRHITQALGVIELGLVCVNDDPAGRWDSVGRPQPDYAVKIEQPDAEGFGEVGFAGPGFFDAYDEPWTWRAELMPDGWFATGDIGRLDSEGYLYLAGRKSAVINLAGRKVFPDEIEAVLNRHPAVVESRVYGRAHAQLGQTIAAEVVARGSADPQTLRDYCREHLSPEKVPGSIELVAHIEKTAVTGKIRRPAAPAIS